MISRLAAVTAWLVPGHALLFGLFWMLLSIPESNVAMLIASGLVVAALAVVFGVVEGGALVAWSGAFPRREIPRRALRAVPGVWLGTVVFAIAWYVVTAAASWWQGHRGETDAWLMAQFGWSDTGRLHAAAGWVFAFLAYAGGLSMATSLACAVLHGSLRETIRLRWIKDAISPRRLVTIAGILLLLLWLPWRGIYWRPTGLAPNWQEMAFVVVKLAVLFVIANIGWALVLGTENRNEE